MRFTTRFYTIAAFAGLLVGWGVVLGRFVPLIGAAGIIAWALGQQYRFIQLVDETRETLTVDLAAPRAQVTTGETAVVTVSVETTDTLPVSLDVAPTFPAGADVSADTFTVNAGDRDATHITDVTWPVAGSFQIEPPVLTARDELGLFEQSFTAGTPTTVTVEPRGPENMHVGQGGESVAAGFGEHAADQRGSGLEPASVREYVPGDSVRSIDWKATARLGDPHIREFEAETDRETLLFVDHRASMETGYPGETKLEFARQIALAFVDSARELSDPLGCYTVGDEGLTGTYDPAASSDHQLSVRQHLQAIEPTASANTTDDSRTPTTPSRAQSMQRRLAGDTTAYGQRLEPFFEQSQAYVQRVTERPLVAAINSTMSRVDGTVWSIIITDDRHETEVREAVRLARRNEGGVLVFIAPTVLYEPGGLTDLDDAYERYAEFEALRTSLASMDGVSAFEVGPADRVSAVLASGKRQWADVGGSR